MLGGGGGGGLLAQTGTPCLPNLRHPACLIQAIGCHPGQARMVDGYMVAAGVQPVQYLKSREVRSPIPPPLPRN